MVTKGDEVNRTDSPIEGVNEDNPPKRKLWGGFSSTLKRFMETLSNDNGEEGDDTEI